MNYYKHHLGDFIKKTLGLTATERGVYLLMMHMYYISEAPLSLDLDEICRAIGASKNYERAAVSSVINRFFIKTERGFENERCEEEIRLHHEKLRKASENGGKGGRGNKRAQSESKADAFDSLKQNESIPISHKPIANSNIDKPAREDDQPISEWAQLVEIFLGIREKSKPDWLRENLVNSHEWGHIKKLYQGYGFDPLLRAIDLCGKFSKHGTIDQIERVLGGWTWDANGNWVEPGQKPDLTSQRSLRPRNDRTTKDAELREQRYGRYLNEH